MAKTVRVTFALNESVYDHTPFFVNTQMLFERTEVSPAPRVRVTFALSENLYDVSSRRIRSVGFLNEYIIALGPFEGKTEADLVMSTEPYPDLIGLSWPVHQKPNYSTNVQGHTSGKETRTAYYDQPLWDFELSYDYLPDDNVDQKDTDYKTLMGFFLARRGSYDTFLFFNRNDEQINNGYLGTANGTTAQFLFAKQWGSTHLEPVGFVDTGSTISVTVEQSETIAIASTHATVSKAAEYSSTVSVKIGATVLTLTTGAPGANEYAVAAGVYTFNASRNGSNVVIDYVWAAVNGTDYNINLPNEIVFTTAPPNLSKVFGTFRYAYVCRFKDDMADMDQFMDRLYEFSQVNLRSVIL